MSYRYRERFQEKMRRRDFLKLAPAAACVPLIAGPDLALPDWAKTGNCVRMGLDAGPLEAEKGLRSGWEYFTSDDPQGVVRAIRDFYRLENVEIPVTAGANYIYVTWTNGWSKNTERSDQWKPAAQYMAECRKRGIHTSAYISAANIFWEDYLKKIPQSRKWIETMQPAGIRHYGGSMYRVMANLKLPEWRNEIKTAIDSAIEAGAEGFWIDNLFWWHGEALFQEFIRDIQAHGARRKSNLVWHINLNRGVYNWGCAGNVVGTEDGRVPQRIDSDPPVSGNLGLLSFIAGLKEGWRAAELEHYGNDLSATTRQLMIGECWLWQVDNTWFPTDRLLQAKWHRREPAAWKVLEGIGLYNRHQLKYAEYFRSSEPMAAVAVIGHPGSSGTDLQIQQSTQQGQGELIALLDSLGAWNIQYEVLFEDRLPQLAQYPVAVLAEPEHTPVGTAAALESFTRQGGTLLQPEGTRLAVSGPNVVSLPRPAFQAKGSLQLLRDELRQRSPRHPIEIDAAPGVIFRGVRQNERVLVHLLNYNAAPVRPFSVRFRGPASSAIALIPEAGEPRSLVIRREGEWSVVQSPEFPIHSIICFNTGGRK